MAGVLSIQGYEVNVAERLGQGAFGSVHKATHFAYPGKLFAAKNIFSEAKELMNCEALQVVEQVRGNNNIVQIYDVVWPNAAEDVRNMYIFMEHCEYGDLGRFTKEYFKRLPVTEIEDLQIKCKIMCQISNGLNCLHRNGFAHRDIKPQNILVQRIYGNVPQVKIADYGLSKPSTTEATSMNSDVGTKAFKAPQFWDLNTDGTRRYHMAADIFATGLTYLALLQFENNTDKHLIPMIEGSIDHYEATLPIGQVMFLHKKFNQPAPQLVKDFIEDNKCKESLRNIIRSTLSYEEEGRTKADALHQKMQETADLATAMVSEVM